MKLARLPRASQAQMSMSCVFTGGLEGQMALALGLLQQIYTEEVGVPCVSSN
jgi:hypothetical protein